MPWDVVNRGGGWQVLDKHGHVLKTYKTKREALAYQRALYANAGPEAKREKEK